MLSIVARDNALACPSGFAEIPAPCCWFPSPSQTTAEALRAEDVRYKALIGADFRVLGTIFGDDLSYSHAEGDLDTKQSFIDNLKKKPSKYIAFTRHNAVVKTYGCVAIISGDLTIDYRASQGKEPHSSYLRFTSIWIKRKAGLQFVYWQSTSLQKPQERGR